MASRPSSKYILIGIVFIAIAVSLQIQLKSTTKLKPVDPTTTATLYNPENNALGGNPNGSVTIVEFFDYNCKYCRTLYPKIKLLISKNPEVRVVYKEFPLFGETSIPPIAAALAAQKQGKYLAFQNALMTATHPLSQEEILRIAGQTGLDTKRLQTDMASPDIQAQVGKNLALTKALGIEGAPVFIVANSQIAKNPTQTQIPQYISEGSNVEELQRLIDKAMK